MTASLEPKMADLELYGNAEYGERLLEILSEIRQIRLSADDAGHESTPASSHLLSHLQGLASLLLARGHKRESETLQDVHGLCIQAQDFGGLGLNPSNPISKAEASEVLFLVSAWLEALNSADRAKSSIPCLPARPSGRRGMTMSEKIFAAHDSAGRGFVQPGDLVVVDVDWVMASEISWSGMENMYDKLGKPGIFRNDRFWIAGDHVVDPRVNHLPQIKRFIDSSERARKVFKMTEYQGLNYTIMHTEFFRERAEPGMLIIGSDSHTCSSGALGCLSIGLGGADVTIPLVTGKTWFRVPETVNIRLIGAPNPGIGGKDVILYILKELKRNTVASERIVEFTGPGLQHLSCDARFAISNMTTEFGGITGVFVPDQQCYEFVEKRHTAKYRKSSRYFKPDEDATYIETYEIDLGQVESFVAVYPSPDNVVPVTELEGTHLDGCFIGACTTTEEDLILGAMILEKGLENGIAPVKGGKRKIVPGSMPILNNLRKRGFAAVYEQAGFEVGIPGCSYCVGMSADKASEGEVWLSSQNRNFENRMGKGSIGSIASAATVAASSFTMKITNPNALLQQINFERFKEVLGRKPDSIAAISNRGIKGPTYVEPAPVENQSEHLSTQSNPSEARMVEKTVTSANTSIRRGKIQRLGDFIDTDALAPSEFLIKATSAKELGEHCLEYTHPDFRLQAKAGLNVVVAGEGFGCGSSREGAVTALMGCGISCVIAKSFAFIYARNQPALGLLGITITDASFYDVAVDGEDISIDMDRKCIFVAGKEFPFKLSQMEKELNDCGGISEAFQKFGKRLFDVMCAPKVSSVSKVEGLENVNGPLGDLRW